MLERNCVRRQRDNFRWEIEMDFVIHFLELKLKNLKHKNIYLKL